MPLSRFRPRRPPPEPEDLAEFRRLLRDFRGRPHAERIKAELLLQRVPARQRREFLEIVWQDGLLPTGRRTKAERGRRVLTASAGVGLVSVVVLLHLGYDFFQMAEAFYRFGLPFLLTPILIAFIGPPPELPARQEQVLQYVLTLRDVPELTPLLLEALPFFPEDGPARPAGPTNREAVIAALARGLAGYHLAELPPLSDRHLGLLLREMRQITRRLRRGTNPRLTDGEADLLVAGLAALENGGVTGARQPETLRHIARPLARAATAPSVSENWRAVAEAALVHVAPRQ